MAEINKNLMRVLQVNQQVKVVAPNCETFGGPHSFNDYPANVGQTQNVYVAGAYQGNSYQAQGIKETIIIRGTTKGGTNSSKELATANDVILKNMKTNLTSLTNSNLELKNMFGEFMKMNIDSSSGSRTLLGNTITNLKEELKGITTRSGTTYQGPTIPTTSFSLPPVVELVDFDADPRVPLILGRSFLKTGRDLIDVFEVELTLHVGKEAITFNLDQTLRYSANYNDTMENRINVIDMACEDYSQEVLGFSDVIATKTDKSSIDEPPEFELKDLPPHLEYTFLEGDDKLPVIIANDFSVEEKTVLITVLKSHKRAIAWKLSNIKGNYLPQVRKELKIYEDKTDKSSIDEPPKVELKDLPPHLEYAFLEVNDKLPVIIAKEMSVEEKTALIMVLKSHKRAIAWKLSDINGIDPEFCTHKILMEDDFEPVVQHHRRVNPKIHDVIKNEDGFTVVENVENELIPTHLVAGWRVCIDYRKFNEATRKDHFPLPFMDHMLERLARNEYYCFLDGFSSYFQIPIDPKDQEKTTFACPYIKFSYRRMPFGLCYAPGTNSFQTCLSHLEKMLMRCEDTNLCLNWEKSHFLVKEGIVLGPKISKNGIEVDKAKVDIIAKLPHLTTIKGIRCFLSHAGFYRRFIKDFLKIAQPMTCLLEKDTPFFFSKECVEAFQTLKRKLTEAPILITPDWDLPFELMYDASDFAIGAVLRQPQEKHFRPIHYASKTMNEAESNYTTTENEKLAMVYTFKKFWSYLIMNKIILYTDHFVLKYLFAKKDSKARLLR
nr:reverse transcriptase domain-containing protein [Tanacetum cinerariifolium]